MLCMNSIYQNGHHINIRHEIEKKNNAVSSFVMQINLDQMNPVSSFDLYEFHYVITSEMFLVDDSALSEYN